MSFFRSKQGRQQISTAGMDDQDYVLAGIKYNISFLGSMLVPTPTGHGSGRTESTVEKVYNEKYKAFGYGSKRISLEINADNIKIFENVSGKTTMQMIANFRIIDITYCNIDMKHSKAFVFIVANNDLRTYRAHVFHCDSATQARELFTKFRQAFKVKESQLESTRLRSVSAPPERQTHVYSSYNDSSQKKNNNFDNDWSEPVQSTDQDWEREAIGSNLENTPKVKNGRQRSQTEFMSGNSLFPDFEGYFQTQDNKRTEPTLTEITRNDGSDDEFTNLAEKRTRSFDDQANSGTGEGLLLLWGKQAESVAKNIPIEADLNLAANQESSKSEDQNLLQF